MRLRFPCSPVALAALLGLCSVGGLCGPPSGSPPEASASCLEGLAPPPDGMDVLVLGSRLNGQFLPLSSGDSLLLHYGDQGGQHVYVAVQHYSAGPAAVWAYGFRYYGNDGETEPEGSNTQAVEVCGAGWTSSESPVFMDDIPSSAGTMIVTATNQDTGDALSAEISVTIQ